MAGNRQWLMVSVLCSLTILAMVSMPRFSVAADSNYPSVTLWPIAYHYEDADRSRTDLFWPVYHQKRNGTHNRIAIRPFIFNYEHDPERRFRQYNFLWPLTHFEYEKETFRKWIFPLYYQVNNSEETTAHFWPFYGHSLRGTRETWSTLYPLFQYGRDINMPERWRETDYFWPLGKSYRKGEVSGGYFLPFWWRKTEPGLSGGFVFPYFWHSTEQKQQKGIVPLWYQSRSEEVSTDYLLLWLSHKKQGYRFETFLPLWWQLKKTNGHGFSLLAPVYWNARNEEDHFKVIFPFYFLHEDIEHESRLRYYFPFYGDYRKGGHVRDRYYLFPLYVKVDDPEQQRRAWYFLWPLVFGERTPETLQSWAIPFYWIDRQSEREREMILGLYWAHRTPQRTMTLLFPFYYHDRSDDLLERHFWPFYGIKQSKSYRETSVAWPLFRWGTNPAGDRKAWQLLLVYGKKMPEEQMWGVFPLWHHQANKEKSRDISLLHWQEKRTNGDHQFSLLHAFHPDWSIFSLRQKKDERHHHFFPLYSYSGNETTDRKDFWLLGPLYHYERIGTDVRKHQLLWKFLYTEETGDKKETGFLWRFIRSKKEKIGSLFEFNPFYYREIRPAGETYTSWFGGLYTVKKDNAGIRKKLFWLFSWSPTETPGPD